jgi:hypothetical protein
MSIEKDWGKLNEGQDDDLSSLLKPSKLSGLSSKNPLEKMKKNLLLNMLSVSIICIGYIIVIIYFRIWQVQLSIGVVLIFSLLGVYTAFVQYKKLKANISERPVLDELKRHHESINTWIKTQQRVALLIYPICAAGGFMLGGVVGSGKTVEQFMGKSFVIIILLITIVIITPAAYYLAKRMCQYSFGKHLDALKENIKALEEEK